MPAFTSQVANLRAAGPVVNVEIAVGAATEQVLRAAGAAVPPPVVASAMLDTGAAATVLRAGIAAQLGLRPVGVARVSTPTSADVECDEYLVRIVFPQRVVMETVVVEAPMAGQNVECLIGRDVLAHAVFVYVGASDLFTLSF